jgi:hypothetical protein
LFAQSDIARFMDKVMPEPNSGCWLWMGSVKPLGYGSFNLGRRPSRRTLQAHRFSYMADKGAIPAGLQLDHKCRIRCCVNPDHLEPVTAGENVARSMRSRGLAGHFSETSFSCGHPKSPENSRKRYDRPGQQVACRICWNRSQNKWRREARAA